MEHEIFLSYRRDDHPGYVARLGDALKNAFGDVVFRDVENILAGDDWQQVLKRKVSQAEVVVAVIGAGWESRLSPTNGSSNQDWVRLELNTAKELGLPVIPVLFDGVEMPAKETLCDLAWLRDKQVHHLSDTQERWVFDIERLCEQIEQITSLKKQGALISLRAPLSLLVSIVFIGLVALLAWTQIKNNRTETVTQPTTTIIQNQSGDNGTQIGTVRGTLTIDSSRSNPERQEPETETEQ